MSVVRVVCLSTLLTGCSDQFIGFLNDKPSATIASPSDEQTLFQGVAQQFRGVAEDLDDSFDELTVTWKADGVEVCAPASPDEIGDAFCDIALPAGPTEITFVVTDGKERAEDVKIFWARPSAEPTAEITSLSPDFQYYADQPIEFEGTVSDLEDDEDDEAQVQARWESSLDGPLPAVDTDVAANGVVSGLGFLSEGDHLIRLYAEDTAGNETFDSALVRVGPANRPPDCEGITSPQNGDVYRVGENIPFTARVTDPDVPSNALDVTWTSDNESDGQFATSTPASNGEVNTFSNTLSETTHLITFTAEDEFGQTCTSNIAVTVDSPPTIQLTSPQSNEVFAANTPIDFSALVADPPNAPTTLGLAWEDEHNGTVSRLDTGSADAAGVAAFEGRGLLAGQHTITLTATDLFGLTTQAQLTYRVNGLPGPVDVEIAPTPPDTEDALVVQVTTPSTDPDGDPVTYSYAWYRDGQLVPTQTTAQIPASETAKGETWRVEVTPSDAYGDGPVTSVSTVIRNTAPELDDASIPGGPFFETSTITCSPGLATDADGDNVSYDYSWAVDGVPQTATTQTLDGGFFSKGDLVSCEATPTDGSTSGLPVSSPAVTILNTPPQVSDVSITPSAPEQDATIRCDWTFTDDDNDTPQTEVTWLVNSVAVADTGATLTQSVLPPDVVTCQVTAKDDEVDGNTLSANATVVESAPTIDSVNITPNVPTAAEQLTCEYTGFSDPQGESDQSRYAWTVGGIPAGTGPTLSIGYAKDDEVVCTVTPSDGDFDGAPLSDSVVIQNSPPTGPVVDIDPDFPLAGLDDLVCSLATRSTDPDGDPVSYDFAWTVGGLSFFGATDAPDGQSSTVSASDFGGFEEWECTATPTDGEDAGPAGSDSVITIPSIDPKVATGGSHSCKLDRRGEVSCWGLNQLGRLSVPGELFIDVDAGFNYTCGVIQDGTLACWGVETAPDDQFDPPSGDYTSVGAGVDYACATTPNSGIVCWGDEADPDGVIADAPATGIWQQVSLGERHACAIRDSGALVCWGNNGQNQVTGRTSLPRPTGAVRSVAAGYLHNCAVLETGAIQCWGNNFLDRSTPPAGTDFAAVAAGVSHSCGVRNDGSAECWGFDSGGRTTPPTTRPDGSAIQFVHADVTNHSCGIESNGTAFCWGPDDDGQASPP